MSDGNEKLYDFVSRSIESSKLLGLDGPSFTVQSEAHDADINNIVGMFGIGAKMPESLRMPEYGDYSELPGDYLKAFQFVQDAQNEFMKIPADVRSQFNNDPGLFMESVLDANNLEKMRELGLAKPLELDKKIEIVDNGPNAVIPPQT